MKPKKKRHPKSMRIDVQNAEVSCSWKDSTLTLFQYDNGEVSRRVVIEIDGPYAVSNLREQLNKIVANWQSDLKLAAPPS
jgi:hypothetical protein